MLQHVARNAQITQWYFGFVTESLSIDFRCYSDSCGTMFLSADNARQCCIDLVDGITYDYGADLEVYYSCEGIYIFGVKVIYINACAADEQTQYRASFKLFYVIL